ncbi:hypothetical protein OG223_31960 [Streptomyces sp. NBC_01478]|uniref:hypothetical protein n=1 Tax=Streptomyces sp. NBC_01478 TaxID=2903882 RepID=UPI002E36D414|nr:hypothetical protein [Streptomyces sp. NBC_01478]
MLEAVDGRILALDGASVITAVGGVAVAVIAAGVALWQTRRTRVLEKEKIRLQLDADLRLREREWAHERSLSERDRRRAAQQADQEQARTAEQVAARRSSLVAEAAAYCARLARELETLRILDMSHPLREANRHAHDLAYTASRRARVLRDHTIEPLPCPPPLRQAARSTSPAPPPPE